MSVPITAFVYRFVFRFEYFAFLHLCSIFFVLGIGADDNFVLLDAWKQSFVDVPEVESPDETTLRRLLYSFSRTMEAVFNTSLTTAVAFLCLGLSPLMPVRTFGAGQQKRAKFPTSKAPISAVFHSFRLIFGRAIISRNGLEAWMLLLGTRARGTLTLKRT